MLYEQNKLSVIPENDGNSWKLMTEQANILLKSKFLPNSIQTPEQAIAIMMTARELNIPPMAAFSTINVIQGKPTVSPQLMLALINRSGQLENIEIHTDAVKGMPVAVSVTMKRKGRSPHSETFSREGAQSMGILGKDNWKKQPETMMKWRAVAACARVVFPDIVLGFYTPDEMGANTTDAGDYLQTETAQAMRQVEPQQPRPTNDFPLSPRDEYELKIAALLSELNAAGDSILWSKAKLKEYVNEMFEVESGLDALSNEHLEMLIGDLSGRLQIAQQPEEVEVEAV
jgi:hypothetical protein